VPVARLRQHRDLLGALMMRELTSRFGRENIGFLWIAGEPLLFCLGIVGLWTLIKPTYEHGLPVGAFCMTGYIPLLLIRHGLSRGVSCIAANAGLLLHRRISLLHLFIARMLLEILGIGLAFVCTFVVLFTLGLVDPPKDMGLVLSGYFLLGWFSFGISIVVGALSEMSEVVEKTAGLLGYIMIPFSGTFFMLDWLPEPGRSLMGLSPMVHGPEMIRHGFFGETAHTYENPVYLAAWSVGLTLLGLVLLRVAARKDWSE